MSKSGFWYHSDPLMFHDPVFWYGIGTPTGIPPEWSLIDIEGWEPEDGLIDEVDSAVCCAICDRYQFSRRRIRLTMLWNGWSGGASGPGTPWNLSTSWRRVCFMSRKRRRCWVKPDTLPRAAMRSRRTARLRAQFIMIQPMLDIATSSPWGITSITPIKDRVADMLVDSHSFSVVSSSNGFWNLSRPKAVPRGEDWLSMSSSICIWRSRGAIYLSADTLETSWPHSRLSLRGNGKVDLIITHFCVISWHSVKNCKPLSVGAVLQTRSSIFSMRVCVWII